MNRLFALVAIFAFLLFPSFARAEDSQSSDKPSQQQPAPEKPAQGSGEGARNPARREEVDEAQDRAGRIEKMAAYFRSKGGLADSVAAATARAEKAEAELATAREQLTALKAENERLKADWKALEDAALAPGDSKSEASQKAAAAINAQVGKELRSIGHVPKQQKESAAGEGSKDSSKDRPLTALQLIALGRQKAHLN
jgi:hypothetical protein